MRKEKEMKEEKEDLMSMIKDVFKGIDPELDEVMDKTMEEKKRFDAIDENRKLLTIDVRRDKTKIEFDTDTIDQMCAVANIAIDHILKEIPRSKRKAVLHTAIYGLELMD